MGARQSEHSDYPHLTAGTKKGGDTIAIKNAGLPNIIGKFNAQNNCTSGKFQTVATGAFYNNNPYPGNINSGVGDSSTGYSFDASRSNSIYGKSSTVQPPALVLLPQIKF